MIERRKVLKGIGLAISAACRVSGHSANALPRNRPRRFRSRACTRRQVLSFAAIFLADRAGLWAKNGLETEVKQVQGGPLAMVALTNREAQFCGCCVDRSGCRLGQGHQDHCHQRLHRLAGYAGHGAQGLDVARRYLAQEPARGQTEGVQGRTRRRVDDRRWAGAIHALSCADGRASIRSATCRSSR